MLSSSHDTTAATAPTTAGSLDWLFPWLNQPADHQFVPVMLADETIITWTDPDIGTDVALSFQEAQGCSAIW